ncbi:MAG: hypothetical protein LQ344_001937 [Seirophora lacunosa]|nr:MAG: hypothetical protein LQ344_001937 [Seirophora lacunosa]
MATMDSSEFISALSSPIFAVYAGPTKKRFLVHGALLSQSPVLRSMVLGEWKESSERSIKLEEWDAQTPHPSISVHRQGNFRKEGQSDNEQEPEEYEEATDLSDYQRPITPLCNFPSVGQVYVDMGKTLVQHAHVYVLAQYLQLDKLKHLAFYKMQPGLNELNDLLLGPDCVAQIAHLARHVYSSTQSMTSFDEPLRKLGRP